MKYIDWPSVATAIIGVINVISGAIIIWMLVWTFVAIFTVPAGAYTSMSDGQCYRFESGNLGGIPHIANAYWPIPCP